MGEKFSTQILNRFCTFIHILQSWYVIFSQATRFLKVILHCGLEQPKIQTAVLGHSLVHSLVRSLTRSLFSLTPELVGKRFVCKK